MTNDTLSLGRFKLTIDKINKDILSVDKTLKNKKMYQTKMKIACAKLVNSSTALSVTDKREIIKNLKLLITKL